MPQNIKKRSLSSGIPHTNNSRSAGHSLSFKNFYVYWIISLPFIYTIIAGVGQLMSYIVLHSGAIELKEERSLIRTLMTNVS